MADRDELLSRFTDVTGIDAERAKFYLESAAWQLEVRQYIMQVVNDKQNVMQWNLPITELQGAKFLRCVQVPFHTGTWY